MERMKEKNYDMSFLSNYFHCGWNAVYEVQILDTNNNVLLNKPNISNTFILLLGIIIFSNDVQFENTR